MFTPVNTITACWVFNHFGLIAESVAREGEERHYFRVFTDKTERKGQFRSTNCRCKSNITTVRTGIGPNVLKGINPGQKNILGGGGFFKHNNKPWGCGVSRLAEN